MSTAPNQPAKAHPQPPPNVIIQMSGAPGSGKSTLSHLLQQAIGKTVVIDHDVIRSSLLSSPSTSFDQAAKSAYNMQFALAEDLLKQGFSVIIDSTCNFQETVDQGCKLAKQYGFVYWYVECKVGIGNMEVLDVRLRGREGLRSQRRGVGIPPIDTGEDEREGDWKKVFTRWIDSPCRPEEGNVVLVDGMGDLAVQRDYALKQILGSLSSERASEG